MTGTSAVVPLPYPVENTASMIVILIYTDHITIRTGSDRTSWTGLVTIDYY